MILLALLASNLPLPFVHRHELDGEQTQRSTSLSRHIDRYHARSAREGQQWIGWHVHFLSPWQTQGDHQDEDDQRQESVAPLLTVSLDVAPERDLSTRVWRNDSMAVPSATTVSQVARKGTKQFLSSYGCSVAVSDLVSVRLC